MTIPTDPCLALPCLVLLLVLYGLSVLDCHVHAMQYYAHAMSYACPDCHCCVLVMMKQGKARQGKQETLDLPSLPLPLALAHPPIAIGHTKP